MRKIMSVPELVGVAVMLIGIAMGYYGSVGSTLGVSRAVGGLDATVSDIRDTEGLGGALAKVAANLGAATRLRAVSDIGSWTFWLGLSIFVVASRISWNASLRRMAERSAAGADASRSAG